MVTWVDEDGGRDLLRGRQGVEGGLNGVIRGLTIDGRLGDDEGASRRLSPVIDSGRNRCHGYHGGLRRLDLVPVGQIDPVSAGHDLAEGVVIGGEQRGAPESRTSRSVVLPVARAGRAG
ncbi:hypothetical protein HYQ46_012389 [Verticillium longisporum]|nr:hypothetical protein HYQ46_012389 [Verticillium longisporum]